MSISCKLLPADDEAHVHVSHLLSIGPPISIFNWTCFVLLTCLSVMWGLLLVAANRLTCGLLVARITGLTLLEEIVQRIMRVLLSGFFARYNYALIGSPVTSLQVKLQNLAKDPLIVHQDVETALGCYACCYRSAKDEEALSSKEVVLIWNHGGGYAMGSAYTDAAFYSKALALLEDANVKSVVLAVHYPLLHIASAQSGKAIDAVVAAYDWAKQNCGSAKIILGGDSAGGHLAIVSVLNRQLKVDGLVLLSPLCNANTSTWAREAQAQRSTDYMNTELVHIWKDAWCGGDYSHPNVLIDLNNLSALPGCILVEAGGGEIFRNQIESFVEAASAQRKHVQFEIAEHMPHEYLLTPHLQQHWKSKEALNRLCDFISSSIN